MALNGYKKERIHRNGRAPFYIRRKRFLQQALPTQHLNEPGLAGFAHGAERQAHFAFHPAHEGQGRLGRNGIAFHEHGLMQGEELMVKAGGPGRIDLCPCAGGYDPDAPSV